MATTEKVIDYFVKNWSLKKAAIVGFTGVVLIYGIYEGIKAFSGEEEQPIAAAGLFNNQPGEVYQSESVLLRGVDGESFGGLVNIVSGNDPSHVISPCAAIGLDKSGNLVLYQAAGTFHPIQQGSQGLEESRASTVLYTPLSAIEQPKLKPLNWVK